MSNNLNAAGLISSLPAILGCFIDRTTSGSRLVDIQPNDVYRTGVGPVSRRLLEGLQIEQ
ncbi:MAG: hypothetical protein QG597_485, partial [Actinomycetota bacterium]|nr:hypothetical protein [Actinomycetota bacterium]